MKYIIGNWKANKNLVEAEAWLEEFKKNDLAKLKGQATVILCPAYSFLPLVKKSLKSFEHIKIGAQDISFYHAGSYTGEVAAYSLTNIAEYVILGHSERKKYFHETDAVVEQKAENAHDFGIEPIVCIRGTQDQIPKRTKYVVYEPVHAIGTGENEPVAKIIDIKHQLRLERDTIFIYGGSVNEQNADKYLKNEKIDGVLVGGASLDPDKFYKIAISA